MAITYPVKLSVTLRPMHHNRVLLVEMGINQNFTTISLNDTTTTNWEFETNTDCSLTVEFLNNQDQEAVVVEAVRFFGIEDPKFAWAGVFEPEYPEPWATQQRSQGVVLNPQLSPHTYLSWPGKWTLTFSVPVFTWIHRTQGLGWMYT